MLVPQRLRDRPRWNQLRGFGNSAVARSTIAIPIVGYLLLFNAEVIKFLELHTDFCDGSLCRISWRLYCFYFGCCLIALGSGTYALYCPAIIKRYSDAATFFRSEKEFFAHPKSLAHLFDRIEVVKKRPAEDSLNLKSLIQGSAGLGVEHSSIISGSMNEHYYLENRRNALARITTFLAYIFGGVLLLLPTGLTAIQILQKIMNIG